MNYRQHFKAARPYFVDDTEGFRAAVSDFGAVTPSAQSVQHALNLAGANPPLVEDGKIGPLSIAALRAFQSVHGLTVDGKLGPQSYTALGLMGTPMASAPASAPTSTAGPIPSAYAAAPLAPAFSDPLSSLSTAQKMALGLGSVALVGVGIALIAGGGKRKK